MNFLDERAILLLCVYSNKEVNSEEKISVSDIKKIVRKVYDYRPYVRIILFNNVLLDWAEFYKMSVVRNGSIEDAYIEYKDFNVEDYLQNTIQKDSSLLKAFIEATKDAKLKEDNSHSLKMVKKL